MCPHSRFGLHGCIAYWDHRWRSGRLSLCGNVMSQFDSTTGTPNQQRVNILGIYRMHCNNGRKSNSDEVAGLATTCHCEYETKYNGTPTSDACGVMSDPWPSKCENGIRTFRQEKGQKHSVATMSHRVYHVGNLGCYKCANHDMQVRDVPPGTRGSAISAKPASTAPTN